MSDRPNRPAEPTAPNPAARPNIVLIMLDDLGYGDLSSYGSSTISTPRMDSIGQDGRIFRQAYAGAPVCTPSRTALLTGRYAQRVGLPVVLFPNEPCGLPESEYTIADALKGAGYRTGIFGKWHLGDPRRGENPEPDQLRHLPSRHGFDRFFGIPYSNDMGWPDWQDPASRLPLYLDDEVFEENVREPEDQQQLTRRYTDAAIDFIRECKERETPFFAYIPHSAPHEPICVPPESRGKSQEGDYGDLVQEVIDVEVGRVLDELRDQDLEDSTLVILTSDNGPWHFGETGGLRGRKTDPFEGGVRDPFMVRWPGRIRCGESQEPISFLDLLPTLIDLAGAPAPPADGRKIDGISIRAALGGQPLLPGRTLFYYGDYVEGPDDGDTDLPDWRWNVGAVRRGPWKLVFPGLPGRELLFNLDTDRGETTDVAQEHPVVLGEMRALARDFNEEIQQDKEAALRRACPEQHHAD